MIGFLGIGGHDRLRTLLSSYVDGQVSDAESRRVETHLTGCDECRKDLEDLRATVGLLKRLPELEVPRSFVLHSEPATVRDTGTFVWTTGLATSMAAVALVALLLGDVLGLLTQAGRIDVRDVREPTGVLAAAAPAAAVAAPASVPAPAAAPLAPDLPAFALEAPAAPEAAAALRAPLAREAPAPAQPAPEPREAAVASRAAAQPEAAAAAIAPAAAPEEPVPAPLTAAAPPEPTPALEAAAPTAAAAVAPAEAADFAAADLADEERQESVTTESEAAPSVAAAPEVLSLERDEVSIPAEKADEGVRVPLWQLEATAGAVLGLLLLAMIWLARRRQQWLG